MFYYSVLFPSFCCPWSNLSNRLPLLFSTSSLLSSFTPRLNTSVPAVRACRASGAWEEEWRLAGGSLCPYTSLVKACFDRDGFHGSSCWLSFCHPMAHRLSCDTWMSVYFHVCSGGVKTVVCPRVTVETSEQI